MANKPESAMVYIIDDEYSVRRALSRLMHAAGLGTKTFSNVDEFEADAVESGSGCVVADVHMPGSSPLGLPSRLAERGVDLPVIYITGRDSDQTRERARAAGAVGYFRKPIDDQALIDAINWVIHSH
ncbi:MAG: response regulator [Gammaproteobacteria bacterium]|nr:response regulator [Gammaproteobacteria bacterium]MBT8443712.1 response regulator [Gammaproteobacteria bacterium]NND36596.1 response regulator [Gammaproteobacteria bacterium]